MPTVLHSSTVAQILTGAGSQAARSEQVPLRCKPHKSNPQTQGATLLFPLLFVRMGTLRHHFRFTCGEACLRQKDALGYAMLIQICCGAVGGAQFT